jgi:hypothetical protein
LKEIPFVVRCAPALKDLQQGILERHTATRIAA